jgi:hypothetical protein
MFEAGGTGAVISAAYHALNAELARVTIRSLNPKLKAGNQCCREQSGASAISDRPDAFIATTSLFWFKAETSARSLPAAPSKAGNGIQAAEYSEGVIKDLSLSITFGGQNLAAFGQQVQHHQDRTNIPVWPEGAMTNIFAR